jgi:predicted GNAT family acetyltransferase
MAREFIHDVDRHRYLLRIDDALVSALDYIVNDNTISFTHTFTDSKLRGNGYAGEVVKFAVDDVEKTTSYRIIPMCWYAGQWFERNPERAALLSR